VSPPRRARRKEDPVASLTVFRDHPLSAEGPDVAAVEAALSSLFDAADFRLEYRAMVVDGQTFVIFDVFRRGSEATPDEAPPRDRRASGKDWPL
jgi:hypothetical protein